MENKTMMSPVALKQMLDFQIVTEESIKTSIGTCTHREGFPGCVTTCDSVGIVICGGCGRRTCLDPWHVYTRFGTLRGGWPFNNKGDKFFYHCNSCINFLCIYCLDIQNDYPCPAEELEKYPFLCPRCSSKVTVVCLRNVDMEGLVNELSQFPSASLPFSW